MVPKPPRKYFVVWGSVFGGYNSGSVASVLRVALANILLLFGSGPQSDYNFFFKSHEASRGGVFFASGFLAEFKSKFSNPI